MAYSVSNDYKQVIYSGDARNKLKLLFNNVELEDADLYCERLVIKSRIVPNGAKAFSLNNFISKEADLILHDIDTSIIQDQVSISIGTLVGSNYEYVPIGIFNIEDQPTNDKNKTTIKLRDNSVKFDFNYNAQPLIEENGGSATKLQILQDICTQAGVTCNITSFIGYLDEIGVYDNTVTARQYIANIAEQAGKIATINRSGELIFVDLNNLTTWEIPIEIVEKYESGTTYKIGKVVYEDGIVRYETEDSNDDTLFLDGTNNYINGELIKEQAISNDNNYSLEETSNNNLEYFELEGKATQATREGLNLLNNVAVGKAQNNVTFVVNNDKTVTISSTGATANTFLRLEENFYLEPGHYYLNGGYATSSTFINMTITHSDSTTLNVAVSSSGYKAFDIIAGDVISFVQVRVGNGWSGEYTFYPMIVTNVDTPYEPYGASPSPNYPSEIINVGYQNIFDKSKATDFSTGASKDEIDNGIKVINARNGNYNYVGIVLGREELLGKTLNLSANISPSANNSGLLRVWFGNSTTAAVQTTSDNLNSSGNITFTIPKGFPNNTDRIYLLAYGNVQAESYTGDYVEYTNLQITESDSQLSYIPYGKYGIEVSANNNKTLYTIDEPLRAIGDSKDMLYIKNGNLMVERNIGKIILDGTENWTVNSTNQTGKYRNCTDLSILTNDNYIRPANNYTLPKILCNYYKAAIAGSPGTYAANEGFSLNQGDLIMIYDNTYNTNDVSLYQNWLSTHNLEVQYVLEESYTEELGQVEIPNTYEDTTYIKISSRLNTNSYIKYNKNKTQLEAILEEVNEFQIDSLKMGKILGNPAIDSYDLIQIVDGQTTFNTLATNELVYTGVLINTFDTQIGEEAKEQNVFVNGEETFKKWARTQIDNVEGSISLQAGQISDLTGDLSETKLNVANNGATITTINSYFDDDGNAKGVKTVENKYTFDDDGLKIQKSDTDYNTLIDNTGTYYKDGETIVSMTNKDGFLAKDFRLQGQHYYSYNGSNSSEPLASENYDFVDERIEIEIDDNIEYAYATFYNGEV